MEATCVFIDGWMDKINMVYTYNEIVFSHKNEGNSEVWYNMDELWGCYAKWNKLVTIKQILYEFT